MSITFSNDSSWITMRGSSKAIIKASINLAGTGTVLPIEIIGEFKDIPVNLHQLYIQAMLSSYGNVNVYDNTKDDDKEPMTIEEQKREWRWNRIVKLISKAITK